MKLHLPKMLTAALLAAFTTVGFTLPQAQASTVYNGVTYSGYIYNVMNTSNHTFHDATFTNYYWNGDAWVNSQQWVGTNTTYYTGTESHPLTGNDNSFWRRNFGDASNGDAKLLGNTIRLASATGNTYYESQFSPYQIGGIIAEAGNNGMYVLGRTNKTCDMMLKAQEGADFNMYVASNLGLSANTGITVYNGGTWNVQSGKSLTLALYTNTGNVGAISNTPYITFEGGVAVNMIGGGTVDLTHTNALTVGQGTTISVGADTTLLLASNTTLGGTITSAGTVTFANATVKLTDSLNGFVSVETGHYVDHSGEEAQNGYYAGSTEYTLVDGAYTGLTSASHGGNEYAVTNGKITIGSAGDTDWTTYHLRTSGASVNVGTEKGYHDAQLAKVIQIADTTVDLGGATLASLEGNTNGEAMKLAGTGTISSISKTGVLDMQSDASVTVPNLNVTSDMGTYSTGAGQLVIDTVTTNKSGVIEFDSATKLTTVHMTGGNVTFGGTGLHEVTTLGLSQGGQQVSTVNVEAGAELHIVGTAVAYDHDTRMSGSFSLSHWSAANVVNVAGTLISDVVVSSCDGTGTINVLEGGRLEMRDGLNRGKNNNNAITINVANGATLAAGTTYNTEQTKDSDTMVVTLADGATLEAYYKGEATEATIVKSMTLGDVTVKTGDAGHTLTLSGTLTADGTIAQTGEGALVLAGTVVIDGNTSGLIEKYIGGETAGDVNGFYNAAGTFAVYTGDHVTIGEDAHITYGGEDVKGAMEDGVYTLQETTDYSVFYVNQGTEKVSTAKQQAELQDITVVSGAKLVVDDGYDSAHIHAAVDIADVEIAKDVTLNGTIQNMVLHGEGTYALNTNTVARGTNVTLGDDWAGIVRITDASANSLNFSTLVHGGSTLELKGFSGYPTNWYETAGNITENIKLTDGSNGYAFKYTGSTVYENHAAVFTGKLSGDGTMQTNSKKLGFTFTGDVEAWTGKIQVLGGEPILTFGGSATKVNAAIDRNGNTVELVVNNAATFSAAVDVSSTTLNGAATFAADSTLGAVTINNGGGLAVGENATVNVTSVTASGETTTMSGAGTLVLNQAIALTAGTLTMSGVYNVDAFEYEGERTIEGGLNENNGFATEKGSLTVVTKADNTTLVAGEATVVRGGHEFSLANDGTVSLNSANYATFYITNLSETVTKAKSKEAESHVALASIHVSNGATLTVDQNIDLSLVTAETGAKLNILSGQTVSVGDATTTATIAGEGTYALKSGSKTMAGTLATGEDWKGTVVLSNISGDTGNNLNLNTYGHDGSKVEINGFTGYFLKAQAKFAPELVLGEGGLTLNNGYSTIDGGGSSMYTFAGGVSGEGNMVFNKTSANTVTQHLYFTGDVAGWTGTLSVAGNFDVFAQYSGVNKTVNSTISRTSGGLHVEVGTGEDSSVVTYTKAITSNSLTVNADATANINGGLTTNTITVGVGATLVINGNTTLTSAITSAGTVTLTDVALSDAFTESQGGEAKYYIGETQNYYMGSADKYLTVVTGDGAANATGTGLTWNTRSGLEMANGQVITGAGEANYSTLYIADEIFASAIIAGDHYEALGTIKVTDGGILTVDQALTGISIEVTGTGVITGTEVVPTDVQITKDATAVFTEPVQTPGVRLTAADDGAVKVTNNGEAAATYSEIDANLSVEAKTLEMIADEPVMVFNELVHVDEIINNQEGQGLTLMNAESLELKSMTIAQDAVVSAYYTEEQQIGWKEGTVTITESLVAGGGTLYANLTLVGHEGDDLLSWNLNGQQMTLGSTLTLDTETGLIQLDNDTMRQIAALTLGENWELVVNGGTNLQYDGNEWFDGVFSRTYTNADGELAQLGGDYKVQLLDNGNFGVVKYLDVPEPTTGTLSLLALAALAARRRKH